MNKLDENIWVVATDFKLMGADFGNHMTIIRLPSNKLLLHSPVKFTDRLSAEVAELGVVTYIITPNNYHGLFSNDWLSHYPKATHYSAKEKTQGKFTVLTEDLQTNMESVVKVIKIEGLPKVNEFAFIHIPSQTLVLTDLAFNINKNVSLWSKVFFRLNGAYNTFGPSKLMKAMLKDPEALHKSINRILENEFKRIIVSHGDIVETNAMQMFEFAFKEFGRESKTITT